MSVTLSPTRTPEVATTHDVKVSHGVVNVTLFDDRGNPIAWVPMDPAEVRHQIRALQQALAIVTFEDDNAVADARADMREAAALSLAAQDARAREFAGRGWV